MKQFCICGTEIIGNTSCGYICTKCKRRWWYNFTKQIYELLTTDKSILLDAVVINFLPDGGINEVKKHPNKI